MCHDDVLYKFTFTFYLQIQLSVPGDGKYIWLYLVDTAMHHLMQAGPYKSLIFYRDQSTAVCSIRCVSI